MYLKEHDLPFKKKSVYKLIQYVLLQKISLSIVIFVNDFILQIFMKQNCLMLFNFQRILTFLLSIITSQWISTTLNFCNPLNAHLLSQQMLLLIVILINPHASLTMLPPSCNFQCPQHRLPITKWHLISDGIYFGFRL